MSVVTLTRNPSVRPIAAPSAIAAPTLRPQTRSTFEESLELLEVLLQSRAHHGSEARPQKSHAALRLQVDRVGELGSDPVGARAHTATARESADRAGSLEAVRDAGIELGDHGVGDVLATRISQHLVDLRPQCRGTGRVRVISSNPFRHWRSNE
jgi:hypothetical protein